MLVDSHCHLDFDSFSEDFGEVLGRAGRAGVATMLTISTTLSGFPAVRAIAEAHDRVWCSVGVHPHEAGEEGVDSPAPLLDLAEHPRVVGIGETGLDYFYEHSPREAQKVSFRAHIQAARHSGLPLIVHARDGQETLPLNLIPGFSPFFDLVMALNVVRIEGDGFFLAACPPVHAFELHLESLRALDFRPLILT